MQGIHSVPVTMMDGTSTTIGERFPGKALLIVNVASQCGLTHQLMALETLHQQFRGQGLEVLGVPCNQFAAQTPENDEEFATYCQVNYATTFALTRKTDVNGDEAHPLYQALKTFPTGESQDIEWNFEKFLVDGSGNVAARFDPRVDPLDEALVSSLRELLRPTADIVPN